MTGLQKFLIYLMIVVCPLVFFTDLTRNPYYFQIVFLNALTVGFWMVYLIESAKKGKITFKITPIDVALVAFWIFATLTWLVNLWIVRGDDYLRHSVWSEGFKRWLFTVINVALVYYIPVNYLSSDNFYSVSEEEKFARRLREVFYFVGFVAAVYGVMQFLGYEVIWPTALNPFGGRSVSTFGNPNFLSSFLVVLLPLITADYLTAKKNSSVAVYFIYVVIYAVALVVTLTRSSWGGALVGLAVFFASSGLFRILKNKNQDSTEFLSPIDARVARRRIKWALVVLAALVILWPHPKSSIKYVPAIYERFAEMRKNEEGVYGPLHQRFLIWSCAWHITKDNPVIGRGWGCFELFYPYYQGKYLFVKIFRTLRTHANNAHNELLEIISQTGIVGLGIYLWMVLSIIFLGVYIIKRPPPQSAKNATQIFYDKKILASAYLGGIAGMLTDNLMNVTLHFAVPAFLYWWVVGSLTSMGGRKVIEIPVKNFLARALVYFVVIAGGLLIYKYYSNFMGEINYFSGFKLSKRGDVAGALPYLERAHKYQRLEVNNNYELANAYARLGRKEEAIEAYKEALRANAGYDEIFFNMATVYNQMGKRDEAIFAYSKALAINPLSYEAYAALGGMYFQNLNPDNIDSAAKLFERAYEFFPENTDIMNNLGYLYTRKGEVLKAADYYSKALAVDPDFALARRNLENLARQSPPGLIKIPPDELSSMLQEVEGLVRSGKNQQALELTLQAVKKYPASYRAKFYLANMYYTVGDYETAAGIYEGLLSSGARLISSSPEGAVSLLTNLALSYEKAGRYEQAKLKWQEILRRDPSNKLARERLGR